MDAVRERAEGLEREVERLTEECGVARDEVKGLEYQLSSATTELQQTKEVGTFYVKKGKHSLYDA